MIYASMSIYASTLYIGFFDEIIGTENRIT
jgi:hypothetical protein